MLKTKALVLIPVLLLFGGCSETTAPPERISTSLDCVPGSTEAFNCAMELEAEAGLHFKLQTFSCGAHGNTIRLHQPVDQVLTTDACYIPSGTVWEFPGPFPAGTAVTLEIISAELRLSPDFEITGEYPVWTINFEDGGDRDYDDLVLTVTAVPTD